MRSDGRQPLEAREFDIETNILVQCWGSARCVVGGGLGGGTECLAAVTAQIGEGTACGVEVECSPSLWAAAQPAKPPPMMSALLVIFNRPVKL